MKPGGDFEIVQIPQLISATFPVPLENILDFTPPSALCYPILIFKLVGSESTYILVKHHVLQLVERETTLYIMSMVNAVIETRILVFGFVRRNCVDRSLCPLNFFFVELRRLG